MAAAIVPRPPTSTRVKQCMKDNDVQGMKSALQTVTAVTDLKTFIVHDCLRLYWRDQTRQEVISALLAWGTMAQKFALFHYTIMAEKARKDCRSPSSILQTSVMDDDEEVDGEVIALKIASESPDIILEKNAIEMTVLHLAVEYGSETTVSTLIKLAQDKHYAIERMFGALNKQNKTPLMLAVDKGNIPTVRAILESLPELQLDKALFSRAIDNDQQDIIFTFVELRPSSVPDSLLEYSIKLQQVKLLEELLSRCKSLFYGHALLHCAIKKGNIEAVDLLLDSCPELATELDKNGHSALHCLKDVKGVKAREELRRLVAPQVIRRITSTPKGSVEYQSIPEQIRRYLADNEDESELESRFQSDIEIMLTKPIGKEISLDLGGFRHSARSVEPFLKMINALAGKSKPSGGALASRFKVEFESTLRYVDIPIPDLPRVREENDIVYERVEALNILEWLHKSKKVKGIYELLVRDSIFLPHSEEVIEKCLKGFEIEILNWMRADMSIRPLQETCPNLKKLTLYVGTWASLSYWTSVDGAIALRKFQKLKVVEIFILTDRIGFLNSSLYETDAKKRWDELEKESKPSLDITFTRKTWSSFRNRPEEQPVTKITTAVEVTRLGPFLQAYETVQREFKDDGWRIEVGLKAVHMPHIKVAIIDTGVDPDSINCLHISGASFVSSENGESPWWYAQHPHGTQMAKIITDLNPFCQLLVAKVGDAKMDMTSDHVVQAINWAVKSGADIISLSAAFFKDSKSLKDAVKKAIATDIVVIASTAGEGYNIEDAYPAKYDSVIKIAAADFLGKETAESLKENADYMLPGENIIAKATFLGVDNSTNITNGPSAATAIASGIASLILACHRLALSTQSEEQPWKDHMTDKKSIVVRVFDKMGSNKGKYVKPWTFFSQDEDQRSWGEAESILKWMEKRFVQI